MMQGYLNIIIETVRLKIIPVDFKYVEDITMHFTPEITQLMWPSSPKTKDEIYKYVQSERENLRCQSDLLMVILLKDTMEFCGVVGVHDAKSLTPELGVWLKKELHGNKYGFEAVGALKLWAETNLTYQYLKYPVDKRNWGSRKIAEGLGGVIEDEYLKESENGSILDEIEYRIYPNR